MFFGLFLNVPSNLHVSSFVISLSNCGLVKCTNMMNKSKHNAKITQAKQNLKNTINNLCFIKFLFNKYIQKKRRVFLPSFTLSFNFFFFLVVFVVYILVYRGDTKSTKCYNQETIKDEFIYK